MNDNKSNMERTKVAITLNVNSAAFSGSALDAMQPEWKFGDKYDYKSEREFRSSYDGPGSWFLYIVLTGAAFGLREVVKGFLGELGKDLYNWTKEKLLPSFASHQRGNGRIVISYENKEITFFIGEGQDLTYLPEFWNQLPQFLKDTLVARPWRSKIECFVCWNAENGKWELSESEDTWRSRLSSIVRRIWLFHVRALRRFPHDNYMIATAFYVFAVSLLLFGALLFALL